jgi:hypothetical protein
MLKGPSAMRYRLCLNLALVLLCNPLSARAEDQYICLGEHMTGFTYNTGSKSWESAEFRAVSLRSLRLARALHFSAIQG